MSEGPLDWEAAEDSFQLPSLAAGDATGWFDQLYAAAVEGRVTMPWSRANPHPLLVDWTHRSHQVGAGRRAIVIGCALGADAEHVVGLGFDVVAFDVSQTAVDLARRRHPDSTVTYVQADLLDLPPEWRRAFDLVVEIITVQALPPELHSRAIAAVRDLVAPDGTLLVIGAVADGAPGAAGPWPLTRAEVESLATDGMCATGIETLPMPNDPAEVRWVAEFGRRAVRTTPS